MSGEVPDGWVSQPLSRLCGEVSDRVDPATIRREDGPYIGLEHIGQGTGRLEAVGNAQDVVSQKSRFGAGDLLFGKLRPNLRKVAHPDFGGVCSTDIIVLRAAPCADAGFLHQLLQSEAVVAHAVATAAGTKMPRTHARSILSLQIASPPVDEQRRIAEVLGSIDDATLLATQTSRAARATFDRLIDDLHNRNAHNIVPLRQLCVPKGLQTGPFGSQLKVADYVASGIPVLMPTDLTPDGINFSSSKATSRQKADQLSQHRLFPGDILFSRRGDVEKCGLYVEGDPPALCGTGCLRARIDPQKADPVLIYFLAQSSRSGQWLKQHAVGITMPNLNTSIVGALPIPHLKLDEQREWVEALLLAEGTCRINETYAAGLASAKLAISSDLLSGRVRVPA